MTKAPPKARSGLVATDHSKRGRRFVTLLDVRTQHVSLLEAWEHAVWSLCDGTRDPNALLELTGPNVGGTDVDAEMVERCLRVFERERLLDDDYDPAFELVRLEYENHPLSTDEQAAQMPQPFAQQGFARPPPGLTPTVAFPEAPVLPGTTLYLTQAQSLLDESSASIPLDVLRAVDVAVQEAAALENSRGPRMDQVLEVEARPPESGRHERPARSVEITPEVAEGKRLTAVPIRAPHGEAPEARPHKSRPLFQEPRQTRIGPAAQPEESSPEASRRRGSPRREAPPRTKVAPPPDETTTGNHDDERPRIAKDRGPVLLRAASDEATLISAQQSPTPPSRTRLLPPDDGDGDPDDRTEEHDRTMHGELLPRKPPPRT